MISIDASFFLGMHCSDNAIRQFCKSIIANNSRAGIIMGMEEIGKCDNLIWSHFATSQNEYFLFMDSLMTSSLFYRYAYTDTIIRQAYLTKSGMAGILAKNLKANHCSLKLFIGQATEESVFTEDVEILYLNSLSTKIDKEILLKL